MESPYVAGSQAVWLEMVDEGMRVYLAHVRGVVAEEPGQWLVETTHGTERVDAHGEGPRLVPLDPDVAQEIAEHGDGHLVMSTVRDIEQGLDQRLDWPSFEQDLGKGGHER